MRDLARAKLDQFSKALESAQAAFRVQVEALAEQARAEIKAGNGGWSISKPAADDADFYRPELHVSDEDLPINIRELLNMEVGWNDCLGFYIRDIDRIDRDAGRRGDRKSRARRRQPRRSGDR